MAYLFNGTTSNLELGSAILSGVPITFAAWFNPANVTSNAMLITLSEKASVGGIDGLRLIAAGTIANDPIRLTAVAAGTAQFADTTPTPGFIAQKWNHAAGVFTSATSRTAFLNGGRATTVTNNIVPTGLDRTNIGSFWDVTNQGFFPGLIAEVGIWNCALTASEVLALASGVLPSAVRPDSLVMYLPLRENTFDYSRFGNFLTNTAAVRNSDHPPLYAPQSFRRKYFAAAAASGRALSGALTEANDTFTALAQVAIKLSGGPTEANDVFAAAAQVAIKLAGAITEANDVMAGNISGAARTISGAITEANDAMAAAFKVAVKLTGSPTEANDLMAAIATVAVKLSGAVTEANDSMFGYVNPPIGGPGVPRLSAIATINRLLTKG